MVNVKTALFTILMLLGILFCYGQSGQQTLNPDSIDVYSYNPLSHVQTPVTGYDTKAYAYYMQAEYQQAARYYLAYLTQNPDDSNAWYNLSCSFGLLGSAKEAAEYLKIAYKKGFDNLDQINQDKDFDKVRDAKTFTLALDSLKIWNDKAAFYQGKNAYFKAEQYIPYWIHTPKNFDPKKSYTLLIGLHGYGDRAPNFSKLWRDMSDNDVIYIVPEAPYPFLDSKEAGFSWGPFVAMDSKTYMTAFNLLEDYITDLTDQMQKTYKIKQTWLLGFSQGAFMGYILALRNPDEFDGLVACGGGLVTDVLDNRNYKKAKNLKIIISHGRQDKVVDFSESVKANTILTGKGIHVTKVDFDGGHMVSPTAIEAFLEAIK